MAKKRKTSRKSKKTPFFSIKVLSAILLVLLLSLVSIGYLLYDKGILVFKVENKKEKIVKQEKKIAKKEEKKDEEAKKKDSYDKVDTLQKTVEKKPKDIKQVDTKKEDKEDTISQTITVEHINVKNKQESKKEDKKDNDSKVLEKKKDNAKKTEKKHGNSKPKLAIIIDDVSFSYQTKKIKKLPYKVTPSFLPSSRHHPDTPKLAKSFSVHMVHLPLEAYKNPNRESVTLRKGSSYEKIAKEISKIKKDFPNAKFYNNHTGSKFTADRVSMDRLFRVLKKENIQFIDSKTTSSSKAQILARKYHMRVLTRDVFLDNSKDPQQIKKQLKKAINIAKKFKKAIAIGHPRKNTLEVLKNAKSMFAGVELVYIDEL